MDNLQKRIKNGFVILHFFSVFDLYLQLTTASVHFLEIKKISKQIVLVGFSKERRLFEEPTLDTSIRGKKHNMMEFVLYQFPIQF